MNPYDNVRKEVWRIFSPIYRQSTHDQGTFLTPAEIYAEVDAALWLAMTALGGTDTATFDWAAHRREVIGLTISELRREYIGKGSAHYDENRRDSVRKSAVFGSWTAWTVEDDDHVPVPDEQFDAIATVSKLQHRLPPRAFELLNLRYLQECEYAEICVRYYGIQNPTGRDLRNARQAVYAATIKAREALAA